MQQNYYDLTISTIMSHQFYFNDCITLQSTTAQVFSSFLIETIKAFNYLAGKDIGIEKGIILEKESENLRIGGISLKNAILQIPDNEREIRVLAFQYFTKYPIQYHLKSDLIDEKVLDQNFKFENEDAINLAIAGYHGCFIFSVAILDKLKQNTITIYGNKEELTLNNLFGERNNTYFIERTISELNSLSLSTFEQLKQLLNAPIYTSSFEKAFLGESVEVQNSIIEKFKYAKNRGFSSPFLPDTKIISDVTPLNNKRQAKVYELRVYTPKALRVFFYEYDNKVFISGLELKSKYKEENSTSQNKDIEKALLKIEMLIKNR